MNTYYLILGICIIKAWISMLGVFFFILLDKALKVRISICVTDTTTKMKRLFLHFSFNYYYFLNLLIEFCVFKSSENKIILYLMI